MLNEDSDFLTISTRYRQKLIPHSTYKRFSRTRQAIVMGFLSFPHPNCRLALSNRGNANDPRMSSPHAWASPNSRGAWRRSARISVRISALRPNSIPLDMVTDHTQPQTTAEPLPIGYDLGWKLHHSLSNFNNQCASPMLEKFSARL